MTPIEQFRRKLAALLLATMALTLPQNTTRAAEAPEHYDVIVYGGTAAAVVAAIEAGRMGMNVLLLSPDKHLGGMTSSGLGWTDSKDGKAVGGLARAFYHRVWEHYQSPEAWTRTERKAYAARVKKCQPGKAVDDAEEVMWTFEPHVAEQVFDNWLAETGVTVRRNAWLRRPDGVYAKDNELRELWLTNGDWFSADVFIDATYEGDLMAAASVSYRIGRDARDEYGESLNGIYFKKMSDEDKQAFDSVAPYVVPGDPASGFIAGIKGDMPAGEKVGDADTRLQSFNYRLCLTDDPDNRVPIAKPENYNEADYELLLRFYEAGLPSGFSTQEMPNRKTDSNNSGPVSLDFIGGNFSDAEGWNYSDADYGLRQKIIQSHIDYTRGLFWTLMNSPRVPDEYREQWARYGLAADEFADNDNWPYQLYVREARRMEGQMVMTQHHIDRKPGYEIGDSIGLGSYSLDSHSVRRVVVDGKLRREGGFYEWRSVPYPISYGAIVPRVDEIRNLLVPVTLSATHAAFGSIRMEPTYMILGQSAGAAAALAVQAQVPVQEISYETLKARLLEGGQRLEWQK